MSCLGQPVKRREDPRLVTGNGSFVDDIQLPDMLYACVLRSPHAHACIRSIDVAAARVLPGVAAVLSGGPVGRRDRIDPRHGRGGLVKPAKSYPTSPPTCCNAQQRRSSFRRGASSIVSIQRKPRPSPNSQPRPVTSHRWAGD